MDCNGRRFQQQIAQALSQNAVSKTQMMSLQQI
jgi:hypothetical protein